jgi:DNA-binding LacI/PurR family transcriptional regulator
MISSLELAKLCGVSQGTVDRALHNRPGISAKTRERILKIAAEHGYQANPVATEMMQGKSIIVGGLVQSLNSVFFMDLFQAISRKLDAMGLRLHICCYDTPQTCEQLVNDFAARKAAGVILVPPLDTHWQIATPVLKSLPVISLIHSTGIEGIHAVHPDEVQTGKDAINGLIKQGHRHILMVDYDSHSPAVLQRAQGYEQAMNKAGLSPIRLCKPDTKTLLKNIRANNITAVFCHNDWLALEVIRQLNSATLRVPEDISVLGVDDSPTFITLCDQVTTMHYPADDIAEHVIAILNGKPLKRRVKPCTWVQRKSVRAI